MTRRQALPAALRRTLQEVFGPDELHDGQEAVIRRVLAGADTLALMPAAAGRSLCDHLPALRLKGPTLVVSPLPAPMHDQADKLEATEPAVGPGAVVFAPPERLADPDFIAAMARRRLALFVIDEAHCLSRRGLDFRPAFVEIGRALKRLGDPPVLALTASAPADVAAAIRTRLGRPGLELVDTGLYRPNLRLQVVGCASEGEKLQHTLAALHHNRGPGIVYTATVKACAELHELLRGAGESVTRYHAKLPIAERAANQGRFVRGDARVMIATNAFGLGLDKPDLRFVLHWQMPASPEAYCREAGRAGRDGEAADAALLFDRRDRHVQQVFLGRGHPSAEDLARVHAVLAGATQPLALPAIGAAVGDLPRTQVAIALEALHGAHAVHSDRLRAWRAEAIADPQAFFERVARDHVKSAERERAAFERMVSYAQTGRCRWRALLEHVDAALPFGDGGCGHCDNCLRPPIAPGAAAGTPPPHAARTATP